MTKITKVYTEEPTNFQGYHLNEDGVPVFDELQIGNTELKSQTDGTIVVTDKITGNVKTTLEINRESEQAVTKVFSAEVVEDSSTAFQPVDTDTVIASTFDTGREQWQMQFDFLADSDRHTVAYRGKSTTGLDNVRVLVYSLTNEDPATNLQPDEYNELISGQWWMSKNHIWSTRKKREVIDERVRKENSEYTSPFDLVPDGSNYVNIDVDVTFEAGKYYRILVCADNQFDLLGLDNTVEDPVNGGTQFFLYVERTYQNITNVTSQSNVVKFEPTDTVNFERDATDTTIIVDNGDEFAVNAIKAVNVNGTISIVTKLANRPIYTDINHENVTIVGLNPYNSINTVVDALNALFAVTPLGLGGEFVSTIPTSAGVDITANFAEGQDPIGDSIYAVGSDTSQHGARVWSDETIDSTGEFYEVKITGKGQFMLGLYDANSNDLTEIQNNTGNGHSGYKWANAFYNYGSYVAPWTTYGSNSGLSYGAGWSGGDGTKWMRNNGTVQANLADADPATPVLFKVGITTDGYIAVYYYDEGRSNQYIMTARSSYTLPEGQYGLLVKLVNGTVQLIELPTRSAVDPVAPTLTYHYIESPDTEFSYPLFATEEEANFVDTQNGGSGTSHQHVYVDDSVPGRIWYMPDTGGTMNGTTAPTNTSVITYNEIYTQDDSLFVPTAFSDQTITVNEGESINLQLHPQDANYTTSIGGIPEFTYNNGYLLGTAPQVTGDYIANPSDTTTVTVYRTNSFGTSQGTLTIIINNLTAPVITPITGFTHNASSTALVDSDTLGDGSVIDIDETLGDVQRLIILQSYVETYILPNLTTAGDKYIIGNLNAGADVSTLEESDYDFAIVWEYVGASSHKYKFVRDGVASHEQTISSTTDSFFDYGIEVQGSDVWLLACNVNSLNSQPSPEFGGSFTNDEKYTGIDNSAPLTISVANVGSNSDFGTTGLSEVVVPRPSNWIQVKHDAGHDLLFEGLEDMPTLQAGYTYRFLMGDNEYDDQVTNTQLATGDILRFTADGSTEYTTGITRVGTVGVNGSYVEFAVPSDVPPLWWYDGAAGISQDNGINISGSTYVATVTGITLEGSSVGQTGTNLFDAGKHGWVSIDETLSAGERIVFSNAFLVDLIDAMPDKSIVSFGLKDTDWDDGDDFNTGFVGGARFTVTRNSSGDVRFYSYKTHNGVTISSNIYYSTVALVSSNNVSAFLELTSTGNNVRSGYRGDNLVGTLNPNTTTYANWTNSYKVQTGDEGFGLTSVDVVVQARSTDSISGPMDSADVDWTLLNEVNIPQPPVTNLTPWTKALDFSGSNEYAVQVNHSDYSNPLNMGGIAAQVAANADLTKTSSSTSARPWAVAVVFKSDRHNSNQHIWNAGEGASSGMDNIYLRQAANGDLYFGWGRESYGNNEVYITTVNSTNWYGVYIGHKGQRFSGNTATATNLSNAFDIRVMTDESGDNFNTVYSLGNLAGNWTSTGFRMDRGYAGKMVVGGRYSNRSWHGKVASMVVTALRVGQTMPDDTEVKLMITDPKKWEDDYRDGQLVRNVHSYTNSTYGANTVVSSGYGNTQMWLMGDGTNDSYANGIRNQVADFDQNYTKLQLNSMVSNDIENVTINGLT